MLQYYVKRAGVTQGVSEDSLIRFCLETFGGGGYSASGTAKAMQVMAQIRETANNGGQVALTKGVMVAWAVNTSKGEK